MRDKTAEELTLRYSRVRERLLKANDYANEHSLSEVREKAEKEGLLDAVRKCYDLFPEREMGIRFPRINSGLINAVEFVFPKGEGGLAVGYF